MEIRPLLAADARAVHRSLLGDPEVAAWYRSSGPFSLAECEEMVTRKVAHRAAHRFGWSLAWEGETCVGWGVARSHWRRGIASRLGQHALTEVSVLGLRGVVAYTRQDNVASRGVMSGLGMAYEKTFDFDGQPHVLYRKPLAQGQPTDGGPPARPARRIGCRR
ncbi:MAG TPA: GNAT family N-acetyltransferase [Solirubrobacteraceae bacterium]